MVQPQTIQPQTPSDARSDDVLYVDVGGYEGPLDLLLDLARRQKVDLAAISVLNLAEQYLAFIETIRDKRIEIAADYLVMAAWLAYLKSRLMVPQAAGDDEPSGEMMAALLQFRLKRLEAMRKAGAALMDLPHLGQHRFARGMPEPVIVRRRPLWEASLFDLLKAYSTQREREGASNYTPFQRHVWSLKDARDILIRMVGESVDWIAIDAQLAHYLNAPEERATARASSFSASLELVRQGRLELRQAAPFAPLFARRSQKNGLDPQ